MMTNVSQASSCNQANVSSTNDANTHKIILKVSDKELLLVICCWLLVIGYLLLVICCWLLVIGYWLFAVGYWLIAVGYLLTTNDQQLTINS
jgi:hypothetical protein